MRTITWTDSHTRDSPPDHQPRDSIMSENESLRLWRAVISEAQAIAPSADRAKLIAAATAHANHREASMALAGVDPVGEVVIGEGDTGGWTVVRWHESCPPVGTVLYTVAEPASRRGRLAAEKRASLAANSEALLEIADRFFSFYELHKAARGGQLGRDYEALRAKIMGEVRP